MTPATTRHGVRRSRVRHGAVVGVAAVLVAAGLSSPASAATPAVITQPAAEVDFAVDEVICTLTGSDLVSPSPTVKVDTTGTKSFNRSVSGSASAVNMGDPDDKVTMKATSSVKGSITGNGGAFSKMSATLTQSVKITQSKGLFTDCNPSIEAAAVSLAAVHVKKAGKIVFTFDVPRGVVAQFGFGGDDGSGGSIVDVLRRGTHTLTRPVQPGDYEMIAVMQAVAVFDAPFYTLETSGTTTFSATYQKS